MSKSPSEDVSGQPIAPLADTSPRDGQSEMEAIAYLGFGPMTRRMLGMLGATHAWPRRR